jgi:hypothetical protein
MHIISAGDVRRMSFWILQITTYVCSAYFERESFAENLQIRDWIRSSAVRRGNYFKISSRISKKCSLTILFYFNFSISEAVFWSCSDDR